METKRFTIRDENDARLIDEAAQIIKRGGLLAIPTETVYGLGANALDADAVRRIFEAKGRPQDNPLILHIADASWLTRYCTDVPESAYRLAARFWPGPLTMILPRRECVPDVTTGGLSTVGMRCPDHAVTLAIIRAADVPIAAPSANLSGRPSCTTAAHVADDMDGRIDGIVDGGACAVGVESTIIDLTCDPPRLLRPGGLALEDLREVLGEVAVDKAVVSLLAEGEKPRAPGMKYRHYAPKAPVTVVSGDSEKAAHYIALRAERGAGVICFDEYAPLFPRCEVRTIGAAEDKRAHAQRIFDALRSFDETDVSAVYAQCPDAKGLGLAVGNRLKKAAGFHVIDVDTMRTIGITGPTGAGKTSVLRALASLGAHIIDCDALYHEMLQSSEELRSAIADAFGDVFAPDGTLDRKRLGACVFSDKDALLRLDLTVREHLPRELMRRMEGHSLIGIDAIKLIESGIANVCDVTLAVTAPEEVRIRRIMARDGIDEAYATARAKAQKPSAFYEENCGRVFMNTAATPAQTEKQARAFFETILSELEVKGNG